MSTYILPSLLQLVTSRRQSSQHIIYFCFVITNAIVVQILFCEEKCKGKITVKNPLTNNCNTILYPTRKIFHLNQYWIWIYVKQGIILTFFLQYSIWEFSFCFYILSYIIQFHILSKFKAIIFLSWGCNFICKMINSNFSSMIKNGDGNEQNAQALVF